MALKLMYITNQEESAQIAENSGVDWIFIDLEIIGKDERQGHLDTVISRHRIEDVKKIKKVLTKSKLIVRINPIYKGSKDEIDRVINYGADIVMLPYFKTEKEVQTFIEHVKGRVETCLLCETSEAVEKIDAILKVQGIDYIHIGLNDLHLSYNMKFMFELLVDGTVEMLCRKINRAGIPYGFGGIARLGEGAVSSENIISEHYRLGSSITILSRTFCDFKKEKNYDNMSITFQEGVKDIREYEKNLLDKDKFFFEHNKEVVHNKVMEIANVLIK